LAGSGGVGVTIDRELQMTSAGTFALVDRAGLDLSGGWGTSLLSNAQSSVGLSFNSTLHGESIVVRPLGTKKSCSEVGRLVNLTDVKAAIPLSPERIALMQVGELWRVPLTLDIGVGLGAALKDFPATVSLGRAEEGRASVTLYRLSDSQVRFRLRIDKATIRNKSGDVVYTLPGAALGFPETQTIILKQLVRLVNRRLADLLSTYLTTRFDAAATHRTGRMLMVEFVLDPRDAAEMTTLRELMRGDLNALSLLGSLIKRAGSAVVRGAPASDELGQVVGRHASDLGRDATFIGADDYNRDGSRLSINIPILLSHQRTKDRDRDQVLILNKNGGQDTILKADQSRDWGFFDIPL
ncbi:MAG: hypothetical protein KGL53_05685, partial [Elusimicrobia bacterium]|nr:hypothetical protein [Elusimicrobiota bacterium]